MFAFLSRWLFPSIEIGPRVDPYVPEPDGPARISDMHTPTPGDTPTPVRPDPGKATYEMEPIRPGDPEWFFNGADPGCEVCGGDGRVLRWDPLKQRRVVVTCVCFDASRCA